MDVASGDNVPPIPGHSRHSRHYSNGDTPSRLDSSVPSHRSSRRRSGHSSSASKSGKTPATGPEVISNLITSLSGIAEPANGHSDQSASAAFPTPTSPSSGPGTRRSSGYGSGYGSGSFGVDYGAFSSLSTDDQTENFSLDDLPASPPIIRTAKYPSGFSNLTSPKSPRSPSRDSGSGSKGFRGSAGNSRPSSRGSLGSRNDDTQSIGNLSVERGALPTPELRSRRSHDSWGKKSIRASKGLLYMSSREQLRERERDFERKRAPGGGTGSGNGGHSATASVHSTGRPDPLLAESVISEEPAMNSDLFDNERGGMESPKAIPMRDSSLRNAATHKKRSSARRSKRESDGAMSDVILEAEEFVRYHEAAWRAAHARTESDAGTSNQSFPLSPSEYSTSTKGGYGSRYTRDTSRQEEYAHGSRMYDVDEEGAPFPAISQGRRRDEHSLERESRWQTAHQTPSGDLLQGKRSSSRLQRISGQLSPRHENGRPENRTRESSVEPPMPNALPAGYERPVSADSVDDAVESYLCSPRLSQKIKHPQTGRVISFSEVGDSEGSAVFCCVGMGLTRYITAFYDELALTLKLRLITPDRPGVGDSESYTDGMTTPLSWPDDVYAICQVLKITKFSILAHSAGAIYALATALRMPQHIRGRIHLLAPWIPPSQMNTFGGSQTPPTHAIPTSQKILRALPTPILKAANSSFMSATSSSITSSLPKNPRRKRKGNPHGKDVPTPTKGERISPVFDKENMGPNSTNPGGNDELLMEQPNATENMDRMHPPQRTTNGGDSSATAAVDTSADKERQVTYDMRLTHAIWELATTGANPAVDLLVCLERRHAIGFRYVDITRPVVIHHGSRDNRVPVENVKWLGKTMRRCEVRVLEGEGHGLMASAVVMGSVLMEISKEWEDWMRVTGADGRKEQRGRRATIGR